MSFGTLWKWRHCLEWRHQQQQLVVAVIEQRRRERIRQSERFFLSGSIPESSISAVHPPRPLLRSPEGHSAIIWKLPPGGSTSRSFIFFFFRVQSSGFVGGNAATSRGLKIRRFQVCSFVCNEASNYLKIGNAAFAFSLFFWESSSLAENLATFRLPGFPISPAERIFFIIREKFLFSRAKSGNAAPPPEEATIQLAAECCCRCCGTKLFPAEFRFVQTLLVENLFCRKCDCDVFDFQKTVNAIWWSWFTTAEIELEEINFFYKIKFRWIVARFTVKSPTVQIIVTGRSIPFEQRAPSIGGFAFFGICARTARFREFQPKHKRWNFWWAIDWCIWTLNLIEIIKFDWN